MGTTSLGRILAITVVVVIILVGWTVGLLFLFRNPHFNNNNNNAASPNPNHTTSSASTSSPSGSSYRSPTYSLQLLQPGSGSLLNSTLKTPLPNVSYRDDAPGDGGAYLYTYANNGNAWNLGGDFEPGTAWASANRSGLTLSDQTCFNNPYRGPPDCGPWHDWNGDNREEAWSTLFAFLPDIPTNTTIFSVYVYIPYHTYYESCAYNVSPTGCSYEGSGPYDSADFSLVTNGPFYHAV